MDLTPFFNEYLRHAAIPVLDLRFDPAKQTVSYRWKADEPAFAMPIEVGNPQHWTKIMPTTTAWQTMPWTASPKQFAVDTDFYYVGVNREDDASGQKNPDPQ
jgi:hypothetical protein